MTYTQLQVVRMMTAFFPRLRRCIEGGWEEYRMYEPELRRRHSRRTRAAIVHDHIVGCIQRVFADVPGVIIHPYTSRRPFMIEFLGCLTVRFKKLDGKHRSSNIMTGLQRRLLSQLELPRMGNTMHIVAGYELDKLQQQVDNVFLVCPSPNTRNSPLWEIPLNNPLHNAEVMPLFSHVATPQPDPAEQITVRADAITAKGKGSKNG